MPEAQAVAFKHDPGAPLAGACRAAVHRYIQGVCGGRVGKGVVEEALARISELQDSRVMDQAVLERARAIARVAALVEAGRSARSMRARLEHVSHGRLGHAKVPDVLRARAMGLVSGAELSWLYHVLRECDACGALATRFDDAEWRLNLALREIAQGSASARDTWGQASSPPVARLTVADEPIAARSDVLGADQPANTANVLGARRATRTANPSGPKAVKSPSPASRSLGPVPFVLAAVLVGSGCTVTALEILHRKTTQPHRPLVSAPAATMPAPILIPFARANTGQGDDSTILG